MKSVCDLVLGKSAARRANITGDPMDEQRRLALASLAAAVISPTAVAQPAGIPGRSAAVAKPAGPSAERSIGGSAMTDDGVRLYFEETGSGVPVVFVHEFAGDHRSWEPQVRFLSRWFRCITFNARGYPPSDVPEDATRYSQARARDDIRDVLAHLRDRARTHHRALDGRLRDAALRLGISIPGAVAADRLMRIRSGSGSTSGIPG